MEYLRFLQYHSLDVGSVIKYIMTQTGTTGRQMAEKCGLPPQRISDYVNNHRRITANVSLALEKAFNIDKPGYFYIIQANHDVYLASRATTQSTPDMTKISRHIFWDSDLSKINWQSARRQIIQRAFEYGDEQTITEIIRFYGKSTVKQILIQIDDRRLAARRQQNARKHL